MMNHTNFTDIPNYEGRYQVNEHGDVYSLISKRVLKPYINDHGYLKIGLRKNNKFYNHGIHQLVAMTFLDHMPCGHERVVDHIDNNKLNNHITNLQIVSSRFNTSKNIDRKYDLPTNVYKVENGMFVVRLAFKGRRPIIGKYDTVEEAIAARDEFMELNNID